MLTLAHALISLSVVAMPQAATTSPVPAAPPAETATTTTTPEYGPTHIVSEPLKLSFDLPEGIQSRLDVARISNSNLTKKSAAGEVCTKVEVYAVDPKILRRIQFYRYNQNSDCFPQQASQELTRRMVRSGITSMLHSYGKESISSSLDYDLAGHPADVINGSVYSEKNHGLIFGEWACAVIEKNIGCWAFLSSSASKVARLATVPVVFDGKQPTPVVPLEMSDFVTLPVKTFHDDARHIEFTYPGTFADALSHTEAVLKANAETATDSQKKALACMRELISAVDLADDHHSNLSMYAHDQDCMGAKITPGFLTQYSVGIARSTKTSYPDDFQGPVPFTVEGKQAILAQGRGVRKDGKPIYGARVCTLVEHDAVCWQMSSTSLSELHKLESSILTLSSGRGEPIVPEALQLKVSAAPTETTMPAK